MKKLILTESNTKRFMKLASIGALSEQFVAESDKETMEETEEAVTETDDSSLEEGDAYKRDLEENVEENIEETTDLTEAETVNVDVVELVDSILDAVSGATGMDISREGGEEEVPGEEMLDDEPDLGAPEEELPVEDPMPGEEPAPEEEPMPGEEEEEELMMQEKFVNEVTRRVAKRLLKKLGKS